LYTGIAPSSNEGLLALNPRREPVSVVAQELSFTPEP
jgi:hypothetical protein